MEEIRVCVKLGNRGFSHQEFFEKLVSYESFTLWETYKLAFMVDKEFT